MVDCFKAFASHINVPKGNGDVYHEPFKDTCIESHIIIDDCNKHAQTSKSTISYKYVNFCGALRPCEQSHDKEDYCIHHRNDETRMWHRALDELGEKVCALYPFICELCYEDSHFNFQCSGHNNDLSNPMSIASLYYDDKITLNQHDELTLFLGCEELLRKTSLVDMSAFNNISILQGCHLYCVKDCRANTYIQNVIKEDALPKYDRSDLCFNFINKKEESSKISSIIFVNKLDYVEKLPFKPLPPKEEKKKKKKKKKRSKRREETVSSPKHVAPIIVFDESKLVDVLMPITYISDHDWEKHSTFDIENLFGTDSENYEVNNCCTISDIHVPSNDDMFTYEHTLEDSYSIAYDDYSDECDIFSSPTIEEKPRYDYNMPPIFDDYGDENNFVEFAPTTIVHVRSINSFMHVDHDKDVLCDSYVVNPIHDATESYYERGKHGLMDLNNIKFPLFLLEFLKLYLFCLPMLVALCFHDLSFYKTIFIGSGLDLNLFHICFLMLSLASSSFRRLCEHLLKILRLAQRR
jgi:hypothetical protein